MIIGCRSPQEVDENVAMFNTPISDAFWDDLRSEELRCQRPGSRMIVDAHQHFWNPARATYDWMTDDLAALRRPFEPADLAPLLSTCDVTRTIAVQARSSLDGRLPPQARV